MADYGIHGMTLSRDLEAELGRRLARIRLARNVTQETLSEEAGIGLRTLRRLESGASPTLDSFLRVAIALGLAEDLLAAVPSRDIRPIERGERSQVGAETCAARQGQCVRGALDLGGRAG